MYQYNQQKHFNGSRERTPYRSYQASKKNQNKGIKVTPIPRTTKPSFDIESQTYPKSHPTAPNRRINQHPQPQPRRAAPPAIPHTSEESFTRQVLAIVLFKFAVTTLIVGITFLPGSGIRQGLINQLTPAYMMMVIFFSVAISLVYVEDGKIHPFWSCAISFLVVGSGTCICAYLCAGITNLSNMYLVLFGFIFTFGVILANLAYSFHPKANITKSPLGFILSGFAMNCVLVLIFCLSMMEIYADILLGGIAGIVFMFLIPIMLNGLVKKHPKHQTMIAAAKLYVAIIVGFIVSLASRSRRMCRVRRPINNFFVYF